MIYLALVAAAALALVAWERRQAGRREAEREKAWSLERSSLITRIQHPEIVIAQPEEVRPDSEFLTAEADEFDLVGTVVTESPNA